MAMSSPMNHGNATVPDVDPKVFTIAGIRTSVYGLEWLPDDGCEVACLWLLHPRLQTQSCMRPIAAQALDAWEKTRLDSGSRVRLIAVSFDQRNHGSRKIDETANGAWRDGNPLHAQDMFSIYSMSSSGEFTRQENGIRLMYTQNRWNRSGHDPSSHLPAILCLPCRSAHAHHEHRARSFIGRSCRLALCTSRPSHHCCRGRHWLP